MINPTAIPPLAAVPVASPAEQACFNNEMLQRHHAQIAASRVPVRFLRDHSNGEEGGWVRGEIAGFDAAHAERLERSGVATRDLAHKPPAATKAAAGATGGLVAVVFNKTWQAYVPGDKAGFPTETANWLRIKGYADLVDMTPLRRTLANIRAAILGER